MIKKDARYTSEDQYSIVIKNAGLNKKKTSPKI
jgi:hypothetical protein